MLGANRPWPYPCDRSHGCHHFQRSHNSLALKQVLSLSENNGTHKRALIDRKAMPRVYLDYCSEAENAIGLSCTIIVNVIPTERSDEISRMRLR